LGHELIEASSFFFWHHRHSDLGRCTTHSQRWCLLHICLESTTTSLLLLQLTQLFCCSSGGTRAHQAMQQHLAALTNSIKEGLHQAVRDTADHGIQFGVTDLQQQQDQHQQQLCRAGSSSDTGMLAQQQGATTTADNLQQLLQLCKLLHSYRVPPGVFTSALQLLQTPPSVLMEACAHLAQQNLLELTARLDEAEREMLAPLHWHAGTSSSSGGLDQKQKPDQQLVSYSSSSNSKHKLPWASGLGAGMSDTAALEQQLPPEVRIKKRLRDHMQLHVHTEQALQRARATQQVLDAALGSTPLLQAVLSAVAGEAGAAGTGVIWEAQLAQVYLTFVKVRAQVELLQQFEQQFSRELQELQEIKAVTEEKQLLVRQQVRGLQNCGGFAYLALGHVHTTSVVYMLKGWCWRCAVVEPAHRGCLLCVAQSYACWPASSWATPAVNSSCHVGPFYLLLADAG